MKQILLMIAVVALVGCGEKTESVRPPMPPKKEPTYVWHTPTSLSLYATIPIEDETDKAFALLNIADALYEGGDKEGALANWKHAMRLAQKIDEKEDFGLENKSRLLTHIGSGLAKAGNKKQARAVLKQLVEVVTKSEKRNSPLELYLLEEVVTELIDAGNTELTIELAQQIKNTTYRAIVLFYIAKAQAKAGNKQQMVKTLNQTIEAIGKIKKVEGWRWVNKTDQQLVLITQHFKRAALAHVSMVLAKAGEFKQLKELAELMLKIGEEEAFAEFLNDNYRITRQRYGDMAQTMTFLKQAAEVAQGFKDASTTAGMLSHIAEAIAEAKQITSTPPTAEGTKKAFNLTWSGDFKQVLEVVRKITANHTNHWIRMGAGFERRHDEWEWWFDHRPNPNVYVDDWTANTILFREGEFKVAIEVVQRLEHYDGNDMVFDNVSALYEIVSALVNSGDKEGALENLPLAVKAAQDLLYDDKVSALSTIASGFDAIGEKGQALSTFRLAIEEAMELNDEDELYASRIIAEDLATEPVPNKKDKMGYPVYRMKKTFSAEENKIANQLGKILRPFVIKSVVRKVEQPVTDMGKASVKEGANNKANESKK